jgi:hypothetical protein
MEIIEEYLKKKEIHHSNYHLEILLKYIAFDTLIPKIGIILSYIELNNT